MVGISMVHTMARKSRKKATTKSTQARTSGIFSKIGSFVKKALPVVANILPGPVGTVAKLLSGNDAAWWTAPAGDELTTNEPYTGLMEYSVRDVQTDPEQGVVNRVQQLRVSVAEFVTSEIPSDLTHVITIPEEFAATYLLPKVRKVTNAVYLREVKEYIGAFEAAATVYALKKTLEKWRFMITNPKAIYPDFTSGAFPMLTTANKPLLDSAIKQLEEKLRSSIRLPATLCRYLDWRFGRIYKSNPSCKAGLITYNYVSLQVSATELETVIEGLFNELTTWANANVDLYNAYMGHTQDVEIPDDQQYMYDPKEFVLRTNLDIVDAGDDLGADAFPSPFIMDSDLDNRTVFMASCVSTAALDYTQSPVNGQILWSLFPVSRLFAYVKLAKTSSNTDGKALNIPGWGTIPQTTVDVTWRYVDITPGYLVLNLVTPLNGNTQINAHWSFGESPRPIGDNDTAVTLTMAAIELFMASVEACKALDIYNVGLLFGTSQTVAASGQAEYVLQDLTAISIDTGLVTESQVKMEQKLAFANLVSERAHYMGKRGAANELAQDTDEFIEAVTD